MTNTIFHVALLVWSGLFVISGALLMVASQIGHLAEAVAAANRPADATRGPGGSGHAGPMLRGAQDRATRDVLVIPMPHRATMQGRPATSA